MTSSHDNIAALLAAALLLLISTGAISAEFPSPSFEAKGVVQVRRGEAQTRGDALIREVTLQRREAEDIAATLIVPRERPVKAGILWVHWLGDPKTTNRTQFRDEAIEFAARGVVSLLVDAMWSKPKWYSERVLEEDAKNSIAQVVALRDALDVLQREAGSQTTPIAIVGHDYGAMHAAIVAGIDPRPKAYVMIAGTASLVDWAFYEKKPADRNRYLEEHRALELGDYLSRSKAAFLFQYAQKDKYVPLERAHAMFASVKSARQMNIYGEADHDMATPPAIRIDRAHWLERELEL